jgi:hypothetical protein
MKVACGSGNKKTGATASCTPVFYGVGHNRVVEPVAPHPLFTGYGFSTTRRLVPITLPFLSDKL